MLKKMISATAVILALMLSGCGGSSDGENRLAAQNAIDTGDAQLAIDLYGDIPLADLTDDESALLAEAYTSSAGFSMIDITVAFIDASESNSTSSTVGLVESLLLNATDTAAEDLMTSIEYYQNIDSPTDDQKFEMGMTYIVLVSVMIDDPSYDGADILPYAEAGFTALDGVIPADDEELQQSYAELQGETIDADAINGIIAEYNSL
jgi:hypothetical protein